VHGKRWERGQNGEEPSANSPRWSEVSGKRWLGLVAMTSLSKRKWMVVVLLGDTLVAVKGGTGAARHDEAPRLVG
jgi:hypothetical protein